MTYFTQIYVGLISEPTYVVVGKMISAIGKCDQLGGFESLKLLQSYTKQLETEYGKKSFGIFKKANMRLFEEMLICCKFRRLKLCQR